jgi:[ribosomal protein S5]-alanine N-acetyltransferase
MDEILEVHQPLTIFPALTLQRLLLREFSLADVPAVFEILHRVDVNVWLETDPIQSIDQAQEAVIL